MARRKFLKRRRRMSVYQQLLVNPDMATHRMMGDTAHPCPGCGTITMEKSCRRCARKAERERRKS